MIKEDRIPKMQITCAVWENSLPHRKNASKWYVTFEEYPEKIFPSFCAGFFFLMTNDVIAVLHNKIHFTRFLWLDDVWLTGISIYKTNIKLESRIDAIVEEDIVVDRFIDVYKSDKTFGGHLGKKVKLMKNLWKKFYLLKKTRIHIKLYNFNLNDIKKISIKNSIFYLFLLFIFTLQFKYLLILIFKVYFYFSVKYKNCI